MSVLKHHGYGDGRTEGRMRDTFMGPEEHPAGGKPTPSGIVVDGVTHQLQGQPPVAVSHGWGDLSFLLFRR